MQDKQLAMVAKFEREKEQKLAADYQYVLQHLRLQQEKLAGLQQHRLDYLQQIQHRGSGGMGSLSFGQHQAFIDKLDKACVIQQQEISKLDEVSDQRKNLWVSQQQKRKAVELLIEKNQHARLQKIQKQEQQMMDEVAMQKFIRKKLSM